MEFIVRTVQQAILDKLVADGSCSTRIIPEKAYTLGWQPVWNDKEKFLQNIDDEVQAVKELDKGRGSVFDTLNTSSSK